MSKQRKKVVRLHDFTHVTTIYKPRFKTVQLKINPAIFASPDADPFPANDINAVYEILRAIYATLDDDQEYILLLVLNGELNVTGYKMVASGGQDRVFIDRKILFRNALLLGASSIILAHNHPSGRLDPSPEDVLITGELIEAGRMLDIDVLDHIIYTANGYTSLRQSYPFMFTLQE